MSAYIHPEAFDFQTIDTFQRVHAIVLFLNKEGWYLDFFMVLFDSYGGRAMQWTVTRGGYPQTGATPAIADCRDFGCHALEKQLELVATPFSKSC